MSTKKTMIAVAVGSAINFSGNASVSHEADREMRRIIARDSGITGNRAAIQRSLTGDSHHQESEGERKARLINRATYRLMESLGLTYKQANKVARRSYSLAKAEAKA